LKLCAKFAEEKLKMGGLAQAGLLTILRGLGMLGDCLMGTILATR
jgi:hypothetical protein